MMSNRGGGIDSSNHGEDGLGVWTMCGARRIWKNGADEENTGTGSDRGSWTSLFQSKRWINFGVFKEVGKDDGN